MFHTPHPMDAANGTIQFQNVTYRQGKRDLISRLNVMVQPGETLVLLGRSGCGKTTTLKLANGFLLPTQGTVKIADRPTTQWNLIQLRRQIGYAIQEVGLFPHFTVAKNVGVVPSLLNWPPGQVQARVYELLEKVGLAPSQFAHRYPHQLSGGQKQRVGVARALAADPPILLMDEPFGALDPITRLELQQEFLQLQQQLRKTIVFVTHDVQEALLLATRIGFMEAGRLVGLSSPQAFLNSPTPEAQDFLQGFKMAADLHTSLQQQENQSD
jgi:osmoprotectant transport system ATP-binding protein